MNFVKYRLDKCEIYGKIINFQANLTVKLMGIICVNDIYDVRRVCRGASQVSYL